MPEMQSESVDISRDQRHVGWVMGPRDGPQALVCCVCMETGDKAPEETQGSRCEVGSSEPAACLNGDCTSSTP